jgi:hypothetical protein
MHPLDGIGSQFGSTLGVDGDELSPRSSSPSEDDSDSSASPPLSPLSDIPEIPSITRLVTSRIVEASFEIEECDDDDDDDMGEECDHLAILRPSGFEYPDSDRSRSRSPPPPRQIDSDFLEALRSMNCSESEESVLEDDNGDDSDDDDIEAQVMRAIRQQRREKRERRMTSGSISKRTVSERDSDSDREDLQPFDSGDAERRRIRRKTDQRRSLLSTMSIPPEVIIELKEPNSEDEIIIDDTELLAQELPFWKYMDVDSE